MAEESSEVPGELIESIKDVLGRKIKIALKKKVKLEVKGDKVENRVLWALGIMVSGFLGATEGRLPPAGQKPVNAVEAKTVPH